VCRPIHVDKRYARYALAWQTRHYVPEDMDARSAGGNFTDISLRTTVISATDTLIIFRPEYKHGTTRSKPLVDRGGVAITFSAHILEAFQKAKAAEEKGSLVETLGGETTAENLF